jgi:hypothetical protein
MDTIKAMFKKPKKKKKSNEPEGVGSKVKDIAASITLPDSIDPSARRGGAGSGGGGGGGGGMMDSIPDWTIYAGAGAVVLFLFLRSRSS